MAKGRFIKAAERACTGKARFESAQEAERTAMWRFRAYECPVCHHYHLTSGGQKPSPAAPPKTLPANETAGPKLGDLDWSQALNPDSPPPKRSKPSRTASVSELPSNDQRLARCLSQVGKDHRVRLVIEGLLIKSSVVRDTGLREQIKPQTLVYVDGSPHPVILSIMG